jgi:hypothetical protein
MTLTPLIPDPIDSALILTPLINEWLLLFLS